MRSNLQMGICMKVIPSVWEEKKTMNSINFVFDLTWSKELGMQ